MKNWHFCRSYEYFKPILSRIFQQLTQNAQWEIVTLLRTMLGVELIVSEPIFLFDLSSEKQAFFFPVPASSSSHHVGQEGSFTSTGWILAGISDDWSAPPLLPVACGITYLRTRSSLKIPRHGSSKTTFTMNSHRIKIRAARNFVRNSDSDQ